MIFNNHGLINIRKQWNGFISIEPPGRKYIKSIELRSGSCIYMRYENISISVRFAETNFDLLLVGVKKASFFLDPK
jgi:hypothetical protein